VDPGAGRGVQAVRPPYLQKSLKLTVICLRLKTNFEIYREFYVKCACLRARPLSPSDPGSALYMTIRILQINLTQALYYGDKIWKAIVYMFYPFVIYYRFHCTMSLAEYMLWRKEMKNAGPLESRREEFVATIGTFAYY
jgi:hypothetical protein